MRKALTLAEATHCVLDNIRNLVRTFRCRKLDTHEKDRKRHAFSMRLGLAQAVGQAEEGV
jgi:hypothetical protein